MDGKAYKTLEIDEVECSRCSGSGKEGYYNPSDKLFFMCSYCGGDGKVDWVRGITKRPGFLVWDIPRGGFSRGIITSIQGGENLWFKRAKSKK